MALEGDALRDALGADAMADVDQQVAEIAGALIEGGTDFLFGAGMSIEAGLPSGRVVAAELLRRLFPDTAAVSDEQLLELAHTAPLEGIAEAVQHELAGSPRLALRDALQTILRIENAIAADSDAHTNFGALVRLGGPTWVRRVFTTNFDDLLEQAIGGSAMRVTESTTAAYEKALLDGDIPVVYLHGRLDDDFLITETDIGDTLRLRSVNTLFLTRLFEAKAFCLVGYSMSDPDLARVYRVYRDQFRLRETHAKFTYVVSPVSDPNQFRLLKKVWHHREARFIPFTAGEFLARLRAAAEAAASRRGVADLLAGYRWSEMELADKVEELKDIFDLKENEDAYELLRRLLRADGSIT